MSENNHGGKRKGAGRKPALYKTKTISFRVRLDLADELRTAIKQFIKQNTSACPPSVKPDFKS